jgi:hypothetical protein
MARYLILLYEDEAGYAEATPELRQHMLTEHLRFRQQVGELGAEILGGQALESVSMATSIRGDTLTNGPFVATTENLSGFYLIEAEDLTQAITLARRVPTRFGGVEIRPIMDAPTYQ